MKILVLGLCVWNWVASHQDLKKTLNQEVAPKKAKSWYIPFYFKFKIIQKLGMIETFLIQIQYRLGVRIWEEDT